MVRDPSAGSRNRISTRPSLDVARRPRPGPPREAAVAPPYPPRASGRRRGRGLLLTVVIVLLLAGAIVAAIIATAPATTRVVLRNVVYSDVQRTAGALKQLVSENTK